MVELRARQTEDGKTLVLANGMFGVRTKTFNIPFEDFINKWGEYACGEIRHIQQAFPCLSDSDREFLITGATDEDWKEMFPKEEECGK